MTLVCAKPRNGSTTTGGGGTTTGGGGTTITCPDTYNNAGDVVADISLCGGLKSTGGGGTTITCPDTYNNAGDVVADISLCGGLKSTSTVVDKDEDKTVVVDGVTNVVNYVCSPEEGAVYNPVTERCEKTTDTVINDFTDRTNVSCSGPKALSTTRR